MEPHVGCLQIWVSVQPIKNTCKGPSFGYLYDADGVHPDPDKVDAIHPHPCQQTSPNSRSS